MCGENKVRRYFYLGIGQKWHISGGAVIPVAEQTLSRPSHPREGVVAIALKAM